MDETMQTIAYANPSQNQFNNKTEPWYEINYVLSSDAFDSNAKYYMDPLGQEEAYGAISKDTYTPNKYYIKVYEQVGDNATYDASKLYYLDNQGKQIAGGPLVKANYAPNLYYLRYEETDKAESYNNSSNYFITPTQLIPP